MVDGEDTVDWRRLREFADVDLEASFVLSWHVDGETLVIDVDLCLQPQHAFYETPRPAQKACIRAAVIEFPCCDEVRTPEWCGPAGTVVRHLRHGAIRGFVVRDGGHYEISGDFGNVNIRAERPILRLKSA